MLGRRRTVVAALSAAAVAGCTTPAPSPSLAPAVATVTSATGSAGAALVGFLAAASARDARGVGQWLATTTARTDLADLSNVYSGAGNGQSLFWEVSGLRVTAVTAVDATRADVTLSGPVVWCGGVARADPAATCNQVNGVPGLDNTYVALRIGATWKADIDVDASSSLNGNPGAPKTPTASPPSPT